MRFINDAPSLKILTSKSSIISDYVVTDNGSLVMQAIRTNVKYKLTLAIVKMHNFTVLGFNSGQRANEITM